MSDSSSSFANDPLVNLLRLRKEKPVMTDEERRQAVLQLRELRTSPQALGRALRQRTSQEAQEDEEQNSDSPPAGPRKKPTTTAAKKADTADLYKSLGL